MSQGKTDNEQGYLPTSLSALMDTWKEAVRGEADDDLIRVPVADMRAMLDALLASGVVTVGEVVTLATPAETDERLAKIEALIAPQWRSIAYDRNALIDDIRAILEAPVASQDDTPADEEWEDPEPWLVVGDGFETRHAHEWDNETRYGAIHEPRTREQYESDQQPAVPVDALGFPTEVGATFRARFAGNPEDYTPHHFRVSEPGRFWLYSVGNYRRYHLNPASIEDVRPANGRNGQ